MQKISDKKLIIDILKDVCNWPALNKVLYSSYPQEINLLPDTHHNVRLVIPLEGSYWLKYYDKGLKETIITPGQLLFIDKGGVLINIMETKCRLLTVIFWDNYTRYLLSDRNQNINNNFWFHTGSPAGHACRHLVHCLSEICRNRQQIQTDSCLLKSLIEFSRLELINDIGSKSGKAYNTFLLIKDYIHQHLHESLNRNSIARNFALTPSHISKLFKCFAGNSFNNSLQQLRIERAVQLLENHKLTIKETSSQCGFKDTTHFIKIFRKFQDVSPGQYRNKTKRSP